MSAGYIIGITGGIGSGKSAVLDILSSFGACIVKADDLGREVSASTGEAYPLIVEHFGREILGPDGELDRRKLGEIVFGDETQRSFLNSVIHPLVHKRIREIREAAEGLLVYEAALPEEARMQEMCDEIWYIYADEAVRISRLLAGRPGITEDRIRETMNSQLAEADFHGMADRVIDNSHTIEETRSQIISILKELELI